MSASPKLRELTGDLPDSKVWFVIRVRGLRRPIPLFVYDRGEKGMREGNASGLEPGSFFFTKIRSVFNRI
nr:hypothetical protein Iba_chr12dCG17370 [Ipomoea batatas]